MKHVPTTDYVLSELVNSRLHFTISMAKRPADNLLVPSSPSKRCRGFDLRVESMAPSSPSRSPPSLLALMGNRCRKRRFFYVEKSDETDFGLSLSIKDPGDCHSLLKHTTQLDSIQVKTPGLFQNHRLCEVTETTNKRPRQDSEAKVETIYPKDMAKVDPKTTAFPEDNFNSFQFWRTPLPELDMALLETHPQKDFDAMET